MKYILEKQRINNLEMSGGANVNNQGIICAFIGDKDNVAFTKIEDLLKNKNQH